MELSRTPRSEESKIRREGRERWSGSRRRGSSIYCAQIATPQGRSTFRLKITLKEISPQIWRRLLVPGSIRLAKLHEIFHVAIGWTNSHLHRFRVGEELYGTHFDDYPEKEIDEKEVSVLQVLRGHKSFTYEYDLGDSWEHEVEVEDLTWSSNGLKFAVCFGGSNACPPEDCGGVSGYWHLLEVLADPLHEEHAYPTEWVGCSYDSTAFDLAVTNAGPQRVR